MTDKPTPTDAATPECLTCSDHGAVGSSGFDYKTAADFLSGKTVSDDALRKFVAASRGAHDARAALHVKMLLLQGELASREAEIALLKRSLLDAEADAAAPKPPTAQADNVQEEAARLDFLIEQRAYVVSDPDTCTGHWLHWAMPDGRTWVQGDEHPTPRAAIDAARKQGARWQSAVRALTLHI